MPVQHLLKQVEIYRARRQNRDIRPDWVTRLIERTTDLFEPLAELGRVGFDCRLEDELMGGVWSVDLYLGSTEVVGGREDGRALPAGFDFDLQRLVALFDRVDRLIWKARPAEDDPSLVSLAGAVDDNPVQLQILAVPPADAGPGFRQYTDGSLEPA